MTSKIVCPAGCNGDAFDQIRFVSREDAGITPGIAAAARLLPNEEILIYKNCNAVVRRLFDAYLLRHRDVVLGTYDFAKAKFEPTASFKKAMAALNGLPENGK